ncbi:complex I NDUFA9 subunit family protein [Rhodobacteraceae bacterium RKSG542]|uniref:complex I NDUFA9 subunit family protein n=1 Tax=Pseudovibrio flavus TaxID=2529854 RepID=UPI0012BBB282|nr:complex I NDUFA9 subunit family protein [Pseudovibrio flavus]MTI17772.1 complex I NDUFA9 subunit family protein [Pseudovibrio flavus]
MARAINDKIVTILGGSGFVGRHLVRALALRGYRIRAAVRRPDLAEHLQPLGVVGQIMPVQANLRYKASVARAIEGSDAVINLVGILHESGKQTFEAVHVEGAKLIAETAAELGVTNYVHLSAIGADVNSPSIYAQTKAKGENAVFEALPDAVVIRPSIIFGPEDDFFNRFGAMAQVSPALPLIGGGHTRFQPVFVGDVAEAIARSIEGKTQPGRIYELGGPDIVTFRECLEKLLHNIRRRRMLVNLPFSIARMNASILQLLPNPLLTVDQVELLKRDNVVSEFAREEGSTFDAMGIDPASMDAILPTYLDKFLPHGQYDARKTEAV